MMILAGLIGNHQPHLLSFEDKLFQGMIIMEPEASPILNQSPKFIAFPIIFSFCGISALTVYLVYTKNFIFGSEAGKWVYSYFDNPISIPRWIPIVVFILVGLTIFIGAKLIFSNEKATLLGCFLIAVLIQILIQQVYPISMATIVQSDVDTTFYSQAMRYSPVEILSQFTNLASSLPYHARANMPGKILLFQLFEFITNSPQIIGYLIILLSTLGAPLLYGICMNLFHDRQTAFYAFILYMLIPCKLFFFPILNTVTPLFILLCFYLFLVYIEKRKTLFLWLLGGALYILILFDPSPLVLGIIFIGILILTVVKKKFSKKDFLRVLIIPTLAFFSTYLLFYLFFSFDLLKAFLTIFNDAEDFNLRTSRSYWIWLGENLKEFFYGAGLPVMMIFIYQTAQTFSELRTIKSITRNWSIENVFNISLLITFSTVLFLGINRGEITRLWIYLAAFFQIPAAFFMAKFVKSNILFFFVASMLVAQSLLTLNRVGFIIP